MNTSWNTRLAAAAASAFTTLALLHGLLWLAGPVGAHQDPLSARLSGGRCAAGTAVETLERGRQDQAAQPVATINSSACA